MKNVRYEIKDEALCVKINNLNISEVTENQSTRHKNGFRIRGYFKRKESAQHILKEINERLNFL